MDINEVVGKNLFAIRKELKLTQSAIAESIGIEQPSYQAIETGKSALSRQNQIILELKYNINIDYLFNRSDKMFKAAPKAKGFIEQRIEDIENKMKLVLSKINIEADEPSEADRALRAMKPPKNKEKAR